MPYNQPTRDCVRQTFDKLTSNSPLVLYQGNHDRTHNSVIDQKVLFVFHIFDSYTKNALIDKEEITWIPLIVNRFNQLNP